MVEAEARAMQLPEGAMSQEMQAASRSCNRQGMRSLLDPPERNAVFLQPSSQSHGCWPRETHFRNFDLQNCKIIHLH